MFNLFRNRAIKNDIAKIAAAEQAWEARLRRLRTTDDDTWFALASSDPAMYRDWAASYILRQDEGLPIADWLDLDAIAAARSNPDRRATVADVMRLSVLPVFAAAVAEFRADMVQDTDPDEAAALRAWAMGVYERINARTGGDTHAA